MWNKNLPLIALLFGCGGNAPEPQPVTSADVALLAHDHDSGCYLHGQLSGEKLPRNFQGASIEDLSRWQLKEAGSTNSTPLQPRSAIGFLENRDGTRDVWFGFELHDCPHGRDARLELDGGAASFSVSLERAEANVLAVSLQPFVVDGNGISNSNVGNGYATEIMTCLARIWTDKCHIGVDVAPQLSLPFSGEEDAFYFQPMQGGTSAPYAVSRSAQLLLTAARALAPQRFPVFIGSDAFVVDATTGNELPTPLHNLSNLTGGIELYEVALPTAEPAFHEHWHRVDAKFRVKGDPSIAGEDLTMIDPTRWQTEAATDLRFWRAITHSRPRFPHTFPHELGHVFGLAHPRNSIEVVDDEGLNIMDSAGHLAQLKPESAQLFADHKAPEDFGPKECEEFLSIIDITPYQCLVAQLNANDL